MQDFVDLHLVRIERVFAALHLGDVEDVVDDGQQVGGRVADQVGVLDDLAVLRCRLRCSPSSLAKPITVLSGVLSSWLMLAINSDLTLLASWVSMRAECSASQALWRSMESASSDEYSAIKECCLAAPVVPLNIARTAPEPPSIRRHAYNTRCQSIT